MDATVMSFVRRQRGSSPASCARLQSRQLSAHAGDAGADQGLVADEPEGKADQDWREGRQPRPLCRLPDGRGRHPQNSVRRYPAAGLGAAAATGGRIDVKRSIVLRSIKNQGEVRLEYDQPRISGARRADVTGVGAWEPPCRGIGIAKILKKLQLHPRQGCHPVDVGLVAKELLAKTTVPGGAAGSHGSQISSVSPAFFSGERPQARKARRATPSGGE